MAVASSRRLLDLAWVALAGAGVALLAWVVAPGSLVSGWLLLAAGIAQASRLARWAGDLTWREPLVLINPSVVQHTNESDVAEEGCLSIPELFGDVERPVGVVLEALDQHGTPYRLETEGYQARAIQHEIDHLDGALFLDHLSAVKRGLLLAKWKRLRKGEKGHIKEVTPEPAGEL